ncbi:MAG: PQQ-binding-like beta-propeller repeat protein [Rhodospirillales bacterium]|nr:PQQ-binding-like beta-propeller repeat protein [Rhodospirillales bacterium]
MKSSKIPTKRRAALVLVVTLVIPLGGCEAVKGWIKGEQEPPLPGDRISVLLNQRTLSPDAKLAGVQILLPAPQANADWPQSGGYPNHAMHHIEIPETISEAWSVDIGSGSGDDQRLSSPPVVADGRVFVMDSDSVVSAFNATDGSGLWKIDLTPDDEDDGHISGGIAYEKGRLYITTGFAQVISLDAKTGNEIWRQPVSGPARAAPTVRDGRVFVVTVDNRLFAINAETGDGLWTHAGIVEAASILGGASPAVSGDTVVVPYTSGELVALKTSNGRVLWQDSLSAAKRTDVISNLSHIRGLPVIDRGRVIAVSHGGLMAALDLRSGRRLWQKEIGGLESPWVAGDYIFVITNDAEITALSRKDGRIHWVKTLPRYENPEKLEDPIIWTGPILASDRLIIAGSHGLAMAISPYTGRILGTVDMPDGVSLPPVVAGGSIYFLANDAELVAYR